MWRDQRIDDVRGFRKFGKWAVITTRDFRWYVPYESVEYIFLQHYSSILFGPIDRLKGTPGFGCLRCNLH